MKSRTLSSNFTLFKKDITRFAPVWLLWCVLFLILGYSNYTLGSDITEGSFASAFSNVNFLYGISCAVVLFGYLFDPRECVNLHNLPIRRESMFGVHLLSGLVMQIVPAAIFCLCMMPISRGNVFSVLGLMGMQFVFYYGLGIFCVMLTGRRFAAVVLYGVINFAAPMALFAANILYIPMLPGLGLQVDGFMRLCPPASLSYREFYYTRPWTMGEDLLVYSQHLGVFAAIGVGLILLGLLLYRFRKLESAESFMAFPQLNFLVVTVLTLLVGCCFITAFTMLFGEESYWIPLGIGIVVGYLISMMLLRHSAKVFDKKSLMGFCLIALLLTGSIIGVKLDPFHRVSYVPEAENVKHVELCRYETEGRSYGTEDPEIIDRVLGLHRDLLEYLDLSSREQVEHVMFKYTLEDGSEVRRSYDVPQQLAKKVSWYLSQPEYLLGVDSLEALQKRTVHVLVYDIDASSEVIVTNQNELLAILFEECREGNMYDSNYNGMSVQVQIEMEQDGERRYRSISVPAAAEKTNAWFRQNMDLSHTEY